MSQHIMTICFICWLSVCWQNTAGRPRHKLYKTPEGSLLVQHIPQKLSWIKTWGIRRPGQHLKLFFMFLEPFVNNVATLERDHFHQGTILSR